MLFHSSISVNCLNEADHGTSTVRIKRSIITGFHSFKLVNTIKDWVLAEAWYNVVS